MVERDLMASCGSGEEWLTPDMNSRVAALSPSTAAALPGSMGTIPSTSPRLGAGSGIAMPSAGERIGDGRAAGGFHGLNDLQCVLSLFAVEVEVEQLGCFRHQVVQGGMVAFCKIHHEDQVL